MARFATPARHRPGSAPTRRNRRGREVRGERAAGFALCFAISRIVWQVRAMTAFARHSGACAARSRSAGPGGA
jgi:hypothetical protein